MGESGGPIEDLLTHHWGYDTQSGRDSTFLTAFALLLMISFLLSWFLTQRWKIKILPEACVVLTVGLVGGFLCKGMYGVTNEEFFTRPLLDFDNALFFLGLLPPIIFNSGYDLHPNWLFGLFGPILWYALAGTLISAVIVGSWLAIVTKLGWGGPEDISFAETLTFGALISATDPVSVLAVFLELKVDPKMFYLVFGESVLNDAVGIVLFKTFSKYVGEDTKWTSIFIALADFIVIFLGSMLLGFACAILASLSIRALRVPDEILLENIQSPSDNNNDQMQQNNNKNEEEEFKEQIEASRRSQLAILLTLVWLPAFFAELVQMSGIVATLFSAIGIRHWGMPNFQEKNEYDKTQRDQVESLLSTLAHLADTAVFLYLGLSVPAAVNDWRKHYSHAFVTWALFACIIGRAVHVYALSRIVNHQALLKVKKRFREGSIRGSRDAARKALDAATIPPPMQHMLFFSGLRGAVAFSCAHIFPNKAGHRPLFEVTTTTIIIISMYILGATTVPVLRYLKIPTHCIVERPDSPVMRSSSPWSGPSTPSSASINDNSNGSPVSNPMSSTTTAHDVVPRPSEQLRTLAMIDSSYIYPALVRGTPRSRPKHATSPSSSSPSNDQLHDPTRFSSTPAQSVEMVSMDGAFSSSSSNIPTHSPALGELSNVTPIDYDDDDDDPATPRALA